MIAMVILRFALGALFVYSAISKLLSPDDLNRSLTLLLRFPFLIAIFSVAIPGVELMLGTNLLLNREVAASCRVILLLMPVLALAVSFLALEGAPCGCFPRSPNSFHLFLNEYPATRNALIAITAVVIMRQVPGAH